MLKQVTDDICLDIPGIHYSPFECDKVYVGQMGYTTETKCKHRIKSVYYTKFEDTTVLAKTTGYMDHLVKGATKMWLQHGNFKRDIGFMLTLETGCKQS